MHAKTPRLTAQLYTDGQFPIPGLVYPAWGLNKSRPPVGGARICHIGKGSRARLSTGVQFGAVDASNQDPKLDTLRLGRRSGGRPAFTDRYLASLKPTDRLYDVVDPSRKGLLLRVTPKGVKTFYFRYQRNLQPVRLMIGRYPATTLKVAYETHGELVKRLNRGEDVRVVLPPGVRSNGVAQAPPEPAMVHRLPSELSAKESATAEGILDCPDSRPTISGAPRPA